MGAHNYCTQEMVNLLLSGVAASNVHNNVIRLGDPGAKDEDCVKLKGLTRQNHIGFLSLFEHYGNFEVREVVGKWLGGGWKVVGRWLGGGWDLVGG